MEQFNVISLLGADAQVLTPDTDVAEATKDLNRKSLKLHGRHALSWLFRSAGIAALYLAGRFGLEGAIAGAAAGGLLGLLSGKGMLGGALLGAGGGALRLGRQPRLQPDQPRRPAGVAVPYRRLGRTDCRTVGSALKRRAGTY